MSSVPAFDLARSLGGDLFAAAVAAADPARLVGTRVVRAGNDALVRAGGASRRWPLPLTIVGAGKPAAAMAAGCQAALGEDALRGVVVTADGCERSVPGVRVFAAGHPLPDERGLRATAALVACARAAHNGLLVLLGGGASSLLVQPRSPLCLADKVETTRQLLACGADITELNTVRKHLSAVKGGGLLRAAPAAVVTFILSDVVDNDVATIGSGPSVADPTTFADAQAVLARYGLDATVPRAVFEMLAAGVRGEIQDSVDPATPEAQKAVSEIIGDNALAVDAAAAAARRLGWEVEVCTPISGDTTVAAAEFAARLRASAGRRRCIVAGGETTVVVRGGGRGGRNQEFALALAEPLQGSGWLVLSAGTDGIDGPTDAAGAFVDGTTAARAHGAGLDLSGALAQNDSYTFFAALGDSFRPGPTGTNVIDIKIALHPEAVETLR